MKEKKLKRIISVLTAAAMSVGMLPTLLASAAETEVLKYTFDSMTMVEKTYSTDPKSISFACFDGQTEPFLRTLDDKHWCSGWYTYDSETTNGDEAPSTQEMYIENGKLKLNLAGHNHMKIRIPTSEKGIYRIDFAIKKTGGIGQYVRMDVNSAPSTSPSADNPSGAGAMTIDFAKNSEATYSKTVSLAPNDDVNFLGLAVVENAISLEIDDMTVTKLEKIENVNSIKAVPADGLTNVSTYAEPTVFFDKEINEATISNIKLMNGTSEIESTPKLGKDKKSVVMTTAQQLPPDTQIKVVIPDTVMAVDGGVATAAEYSFTTGKRNVVYYADFEAEGNTGDYGMMYGWGGWKSNEDGRTTIVESSPINSGKAVKIKYDTAWQGFNMKIAHIEGPGVNNDKIEGSNLNKKYIISFDLYMVGSGKVTAKFVDNVANTVLGTYNASTSPAVQHIETQIDGLTAIWNPAIQFKDEEGKVTPNFDLYLDNLKVTEVFADTIPKIVSSNPENGEQDVKITTDMTIKFDQEMRANSEATLWKIVSAEADPVPVAANTTFDAGKSVLTISPESKLEVNTQYAIDLTGMQSKDGNILTEDEQFIYFETANVELTGTELLYYDFEKEYKDGDNGIEHGVGSKWECNIDRSAVAPKDGSYALHMKTTSEYGNVKFSIPNMDELRYNGKKYELTMDVKLAEDSTVTKDTEVYLNYWENGNEHNLPLMYFKHDTEYTTIRTTFIVPETVKIWSPRLYIVHPEAGYEIYLDNVTIREIDEPYAQIKCDNKIINNTKMSNDLKGKTLNVTFGGFGTRSGDYDAYITLTKENRLKVNKADINVTNGAAGVYSLSLTLPDDDDLAAYKVNVFLWDNNMTPVMDVAGVRAAK